MQIVAASGAVFHALDLPPERAREAIYIVRHRESYRVYVGMTKRCVETRWEDHQREANSDKSKRYFVEALRKYGAHAFDLFVVESGLSHVAMMERERYYVSLLSANVNGFGFNTTPGGDAAPSSNPVVGKKISDAQRGRKLTPEWRENLSKSLRGKKKPIELVKKLTALRRGMKFNDAWREALRNSHIGKKATQETREKMRESQRRRRASNENREKHRNAMMALWATPEYRASVGDAISKALRANGPTGPRKISQETRAKLSAAAHRRWESR